MKLDRRRKEGNPGLFKFGNCASSIDRLPKSNITPRLQSTNLHFEIMDSPWDDDAGFSSEAEWSKISNEFTNV